MLLSPSEGTLLGRSTNTLHCTPSSDASFQQAGSGEEIDSTFPSLFYRNIARERLSSFRVTKSRETDLALSFFRIRARWQVRRSRGGSRALFWFPRRRRPVSLFSWACRGAVRPPARPSAVWVGEVVWRLPEATRSGTSVEGGRQRNPLSGSPFVG